MEKGRCVLALLVFLVVVNCFELPLQRRVVKENLRNKRGSAALLGKATEKDAIAPQPLLGGNTFGLYFMQLSVGTPPQTFNIQLDTGSADFAIPSAQCPTTMCGVHTNEYYNPETSFTSSALSCQPGFGISCKSCKDSQCAYSLRYMDGSSLSAVIYNDTINQFNCYQAIGGIITESSGTVPFEPSYVDGIMGVGYKKLSQIHAPTVIDTLVSQGMENTFSLCMTADNGGSLTLGHLPTFSYPTLSYTPIVDEQYYTVYMTDLLVNGNSLQVSQYYYNWGGTVVDSGTTEMLFSPTVYKALTSAVKAECPSCSQADGLFSGNCYQMTSQQIQKYPALTVVLNGGVLLRIPATSYIIQGLCDNHSDYAVAIDSTGSDSYGTVLGDTAMKNRLSVFDRANKRIGFSPISQCY